MTTTRVLRKNTLELSVACKCKPITNLSFSLCVWTFSHVCWENRRNFYDKYPHVVGHYNTVLWRSFILILVLRNRRHVELDTPGEIASPLALIERLTGWLTHLRRKCQSRVDTNNKRPQLSWKATNSRQDATSVWTWTCPAHFPHHSLWASNAGDQIDLSNDSNCQYAAPLWAFYLRNCKNKIS